MKIYNLLIFTAILFCFTCFKVKAQPGGTLSSSSGNLCQMSTVTVDSITLALTGTGPWRVEFQRIKNNVADTLVDTIQIAQNPKKYGDTLALDTNKYTLIYIKDIGTGLITNSGVGLGNPLVVNLHALPVANGSANVGSLQLTNPLSPAVLTFNFTGTAPWNIHGTEAVNGVSSTFDTITSASPFVITSYPEYGYNTLSVLSISDAFCNNSNNTGGNTFIGITVTDTLAPLGGALNYTLKSTLDTIHTINSPVSGIYDLGNIAMNDSLTSLSLVVTDLLLNKANVPVIHNGEVVGTMVYNTTTLVWDFVSGNNFLFTAGYQYCSAVFSDIANPTNFTTLTFKFKILSNDATLSDLKVNGTTIAGFDSGITSYDYWVINGDTHVPSIAGTSTQADADTSVTKASTPLVDNATSTITVTAPDQITTKTYTVKFRYSPKVIVQFLSNDSNITACTKHKLKIVSRFTGSFPIICVWKKGNTVLSTKAVYGFSDTLIVSNSIASSDTGIYKCSISNTFSALSKADVNYTLLVKKSPKIKLKDILAGCGRDTLDCRDTTVTTGYNYSWSSSSRFWNATAHVFSATGTSVPRIFVDTVGTYFLTVTNTDGCSLLDTSSVNIHPYPVINLRVDTNICGGTTLVLDANPSSIAGMLYYWSTGANTKLLNVTRKGLYSVTITDVNNCSSKDSRFVGVRPEVDLGMDLSIPRNQVLVKGITSADSIFWSTGATTSSIAILNQTIGTFTYWVYAKDASGCFNSDTININVTPGVYAEEIVYSNNIRIYPNPSKGVLNLFISDISDNKVEICILDILGNEIMKQSLSVSSESIQKQLDLSSLAKGIYYLKVNCNNKIKLEKIVLQ